jgi:steroid 5-alpha reductase family enzyme
MPPAAFHILNWTFISFIQSMLLFALAAPTYVLLLATQFEPNVTNADLAYVAIELGLVATEFIADQQQWGMCDPCTFRRPRQTDRLSRRTLDFHAAKREYQETARVPRGYTQAELDRGFLASGLWGFSRHPNFAAEQSIWFILYQWGCFGTKVLYNWTAIGPSFLLLLFQGSTWLTELITSGKYPEYTEYQRRVGMFVPTSIFTYKTPIVTPKVIRTSELAKKQKQK